jgi:hypothetical protein
MSKNFVERIKFKKEIKKFSLRNDICLVAPRCSGIWRAATSTIARQNFAKLSDQRGK